MHEIPFAVAVTHSVSCVSGSMPVSIISYLMFCFTKRYTLQQQKNCQLLKSYLPIYFFPETEYKISLLNKEINKQTILLGNVDVILYIYCISNERDLFKKTF